MADHNDAIGIDEEIIENTDSDKKEVDDLLEKEDVSSEENLTKDEIGEESFSIDDIESENETVEDETVEDETAEDKTAEDETVEGEADEEETPKCNYVDAEAEPVPPEEVIPYPKRRPFHERYYLLYGADKSPQKMDIEGTRAFLGELGYSENFLKMARYGKGVSEKMMETYRDNSKKIICDFCQKELSGTEINILKDGRIRCSLCEKTSIKTEPEFLKLYSDVIDNMKLFFNIEVEKGVHIKMTNAKALHKKIKKSFVPSTEFAPRVLGVAINEKKDGFSLYIENGSPRLATIKTLVHELTHIWQYQNWDQKEIRKLYGPLKNIEIYEGMAMWVEIQYMYLLGEAVTAKREEIATIMREHEYGRGLLMYTDNYPLSYGMILEGATPFDDIHRPL